MANKEVDWSTFPNTFEDRIKWSVENIEGYKESMEKYSPHLLELL